MITDKIQERFFSNKKEKFQLKVINLKNGDVATLKKH